MNAFASSFFLALAVYGIVLPALQPLFPSVELARALLHRPDVLLMDEPTVGLDPASRALLLRHVLELRLERRVGVLWGTHLVDEADRADRLVVLHRGQVLFDGTPGAFLAAQAAEGLAEAFFRATADRRTLEALA